jgi:capsular polysaccharide biosynthesis protein
MTGLPADLPLTDTSEGRSFPAIGVAELPGGRVLGPHHAVITGHGDLVQEVSWYFGTQRPREHPLFLNPFPAPPVAVDGRLGVLAARGDANYYHYLLDVVVRLGVLEESPDIPAPERWYASVSGPPFQRELLELAGVPSDSVVDAVEHPHVSAGVLVVPSVPAMREVDPPWAVDWLRDRLLPRVDGSGPRRRIYVTRTHAGNSRVVVNDEEVTALLESRGFVSVDPGSLSVAEQIRTFATAEVVVGAHGAALANLVFVRPGTAIVELFPAGCLLADFSRLVSGIPDLRYRYLSAPARTPRRGRAAALVRDIEVDVPALVRVLDEVC